MTFDIRTHIEKLTPVQGQFSRYHCPVCQGNNLTIEPNSGAYQCWNGCQVADIRNAIAPLNQPKTPRPQSDRTWVYTDSNGTSIIRTRRIDDGQGNRKIWQEYLVNGQWQAKSTPATKPARESAKRAVMPYNHAAVMEAISNDAPIFWVEGEPCVDALKSIGLTGTTSIGGSAGYKKYGDYSKVFEGATLVICPDRDTPGLKYAEAVAKDYPDAQWLYAFPDSPLWTQLSKDGGWDVADWIDSLKGEGLAVDDVRDLILGAVEPRREPKPPKTVEHADDTSLDLSGLNGMTIYAVVQEKLFSDGHWITFGNTLYHWEGTHYQARPDEAEHPRIRAFCASIPKSSEGKKTTYPYATPANVRNSLEYVKMGCSVVTEQVNPAGINCTNGVLELHWQGQKLITELVPHDPTKHLYLSEPKVTYAPGADPTEYERLMQCLDSGSRDIWERTIAAALDLPTVRRHKGRAVRAVFLKGDGSNGKDTLRTITEMVLGLGAIASCTATDFKQYDQGRYFPIHSLKSKRLNWPSENADVGRIDALTGLRAAITGDPITFEAKNKMGTQEPCRAVFLFNTNETPNLAGQMAATRTRWGIVPFNKTFSLKPQGEHELKADPRFKEDPAFIQDKILPAFLNRLLVQLQNVVNEGIDYSCTQAAFEEMQREASHLLQFAHDTGLQYDPSGSVTIKDLWFHLREWYIATGTLTIEQRSTKVGEVQEKLTWNEQPRRSDKNVKGSNQVLQRFLEIFPKAKRASHRPPNSNNPETIITGIKFCPKTDQRDQCDQRLGAETHSEGDFQESKQKSNWVPTDQRQPQTDQRLTNGSTESRYPVTNGTVPSLKLTNELEPIRGNGRGGHVGHGTQFDDKTFSTNADDDDIDWEVGA